MGGEVKKVLVLLVLLILALFLSSCTARQVSTEPITIGVDVFPGWAHVFLAQELGYFEKNGVQVELVLNEDYLLVQDQFVRNELDGAFMVYADAVLAHDLDPRIVYISDNSITGDVIVAKHKYTRLQDLKGKKVSVEGINSFSHLFLIQVLEKNGMKEGDLFVVDVGAQDVVAALEAGDIVAGHTYGRGKTEALDNGYTPLAYAGDVQGIITDTLVFHADIVKQRPEEVSAIVKSLFEAKEYQRGHREEAIQIMAEAIGDTSESLGVGIDAVEYLYVQDNIAAMQDSSSLTTLYGAGDLIADFYIERGQISAYPDFDRLIEEQFVEELE
jgi:NitT/TauT family transport system substrate-binding protein